MIGDGRTLDVGHLPISACRVCVMALGIMCAWYVWCGSIMWGDAEAGYLSLLVSISESDVLQHVGSVCRGQSCTTAVTDCDKRTQTEWHQLHTAAGINSSSSSSRSTMPRVLAWLQFQQKRNAIQTARAMRRTGSERELIEPDPECVPDPVSEGSRLARWRYGVVVPFLPTFVFKNLGSSLRYKHWRTFYVLFLRSSAAVWLTGIRKSQFQRHTTLKEVADFLSRFGFVDSKITKND